MTDKKLKTLKDLESIDLNMPRIMTPENGIEHDYSKGETKILDEKYCLHVYSEQLRKVARKYIKAIENDCLAHPPKNESIYNVHGEYCESNECNGDNDCVQLLIHLFNLEEE
jgi:hypothetical protein